MACLCVFITWGYQAEIHWCCSLYVCVFSRTKRRDQSFSLTKGKKDTNKPPSDAIDVFLMIQQWGQASQAANSLYTTEDRSSSLESRWMFIQYRNNWSKLIASHVITFVTDWASRFPILRALILKSFRSTSVMIESLLMGFEEVLYSLWFLRVEKGGLTERKSNSFHYVWPGKL